MEIERKFLVEAVPATAAEARPDDIAQGYLAVAPEAEVRIRRAAGACTLTVKSRGGLTRVEEEFEIGAEQFARLWPLTGNRRIEKFRRRVPHDGLTIELDEYTGRHAGLVVAEVEFESEAAAQGFAPPAWFGTDVTGDDRYKNAWLAEHGVPD